MKKLKVTETEADEFLSKVYEAIERLKVSSCHPIEVERVASVLWDVTSDFAMALTK